MLPAAASAPAAQHPQRPPRKTPLRAACTLAAAAPGRQPCRPPGRPRAAPSWAAAPGPAAGAGRAASTGAPLAGCNPRCGGSYMRGGGAGSMSGQPRMHWNTAAAILRRAHAAKWAAARAWQRRAAHRRPLVQPSSTLVSQTRCCRALSCSEGNTCATNKEHLYATQFVIAGPQRGLDG